MHKAATVTGMRLIGFLTLCLSQSAAHAVAAEGQIFTSDMLNTFGFSTEQSLDAKPCTFKLTLDQTRFNEIMPELLKRGMLGNGKSIEFSNRHFTGMEIGWSVSTMAALVQQTYRMNPKVDRCAFEGRFLVPDDYGHAQDKLAYSFDFDRALFKRIDWDRMETRNLMKVAKRFHLSDWVSHEMNKESP